MNLKLVFIHKIWVELLKKYGSVPLAILFNGWFPRSLIVYFLIKI